MSTNLEKNAVTPDCESATVAGEMNADVVRSVDDDGAQFWFTLKYPKGEKLDVTATSSSDFRTKLRRLLPAVDYYDLKRNWRKVRRHIEHPEVQALLVQDFNRYTWVRWRQQFKPGMLPTQFESCDWQLEHRGRRPAFWSYTKHSACHWLVNFTLQLAQLVEPKRQWRIITSSKHSTVWDGEWLLFDFNFQAMGIAPKKCFVLAHKKVLKPGELLQVHLADHWTKER